MPLYKVGDQQDELTLIEASTFMAVGMQERKDLQALLRDNRTAIDPNLLVFAEEFSNWQESLRRIVSIYPIRGGRYHRYADGGTQRGRSPDKLPDPEIPLSHVSKEIVLSGGRDPPFVRRAPRFRVTKF